MRLICNESRDLPDVTFRLLARPKEAAVVMATLLKIIPSDKKQPRTTAALSVELELSSVARRPERADTPKYRIGNDWGNVLRDWLARR
jgi:hypothetical protein